MGNGVTQIFDELSTSRCKPRRRVPIDMCRPSIRAVSQRQCHNRSRSGRPRLRKMKRSPSPSCMKRTKSSKTDKCSYQLPNCYRSGNSSRRCTDLEQLRDLASCDEEEKIKTTLTTIQCQNLHECRTCNTSQPCREDTRRSWWRHSTD